jgi:hypothetical protein
MNSSSTTSQPALTEELSIAAGSTELLQLSIFRFAWQAAYVASPMPSKF